MTMRRSIELFTGTGGLALGLARAGFTHTMLVERNKHAIATLEYNRDHHGEAQGWPISHCDVSDIDYDLHAGEIDLLAAGTQCQPFSLGGKREGHRDRRNMFPEVFRATRDLRPRAILIENVMGLMRKAVRPYFDYILRQIMFPERELVEGEGWQEHDSKLSRAIEAGATGSSELRYDVAYEVLDAADFGVPQRRKRIFIVAFRHDLRAIPFQSRPTHSRDALLHAQYIDGSYWREHGLAPRPAPDRFAKRIAVLAGGPIPTKARWRTVRDALVGLPEPEDLKEHTRVLNHAGNPGARVYIGHTGSPWDESAKTLKAGVHGVPGGENMLRRYDGSVRYFTPREAARLQTFPDDYQFIGPWSEVTRQLGNAVPVLMAEHVASEIRDGLERAVPQEPTEQSPSRCSTARLTRKSQPLSSESRKNASVPH